MKIVSIDSMRGVVESGGLTLEISLALLPEARVGDHVLVHAGFALEIIDETEARETISMIREMIRLGKEQP
jgi:hydrogenase expression/formation protein HypC